MFILYIKIPIMSFFNLTFLLLVFVPNWVSYQQVFYWLSSNMSPQVSADFSYSMIWMFFSFPILPTSLQVCCQGDIKFSKYQHSPQYSCIFQQTMLLLLQIQWKAHWMIVVVDSPLFFRGKATINWLKFLIPYLFWWFDAKL